MPRSTLNARWISQSSRTSVINSEPGISTGQRYHGERGDAWGCISDAHAGLKRLRDGAELLLEGLATVERAELLD
jgi:hypothetical protein